MPFINVNQYIQYQDKNIPPPTTIPLKLCVIFHFDFRLAFYVFELPIGETLNLLNVNSVDNYHVSTLSHSSNLGEVVQKVAQDDNFSTSQEEIE